MQYVRPSTPEEREIRMRVLANAARNSDTGVLSARERTKAYGMIHAEILRHRALQRGTKYDPDLEHQLQAIHDRQGRSLRQRNFEEAAARPFSWKPSRPVRA
jgi:hypothetical protein